MVVVRIIGGLGNQLFQYACGRAVAEKNNIDLRLDLTGFAQYKLHQYMLDRFRIKATPAASEELPQTFRLARWTIHRAPAKKDPGAFKLIREKTFSYHPSVVQTYPNVYLDGYWQSEKYFSNIRDVLISELQPKDSLDDENKFMAEAMSAGNSVSMHIRRTDYVNNPMYVACSLDYYQRALAEIAERHPDIHVYVFSDDPDWVKNNIKTHFPTTYVTQNVGKANHLDLVLMTKCAHHIIANSSFSWWGAWLRTRTDGIVIAPQSWYTDASIDTRDLIPASWKRLPI